MISKDEIEIAARDLSVHPSDIERDYVFSWLLAQLSTSQLRERLLLKGGNALRKCYFANTRYSSDLDFACEQAVDTEELRTALRAACEATTDNTGVVFSDEKMLVRDKPRVDKDLHVIEARLYFSDFYGKPSSVLLKVRMDVTQFERLALPPSTRPLLHPYSDHERCQATVTCVSLEEILASKLKCLLQRRHVADLFDYAPWLFFGGDAVDAGIVLSTFLRKTVYGRHPAAALELLLGLPFHVLREAWLQYIVCPARSVIVFEEALTRFVDHVRGLFGVEPATGGRWSGHVFFPSALRNVIIEAGSQTTCVRMLYKGVERLIEPYSLRYKHRKDGSAREYFYGFDQTGGRASSAGLKSFVADDVTTAEVSNTRFEPRYEIEVSKAGDVGQAGRFTGRSIPGFGIRRSQPHGGPRYVFRCTSCRRLFLHTSFSGMLRAHNGRGNARCVSSIGTYVRTKY